MSSKAAKQQNRATEIRARLDKWTRQTDAMERWEKLPKHERGYLGAYCAKACGCGASQCGTSDEWYPVWQHEGEVYDHAPADIAWLLDEVERLEAERGTWMRLLNASGIAVANG